MVLKMGMKDRRRNNHQGRYSTALILPAKLAKGKESTLAANRLILIDPRGQIHENNLLEFLEKHIEPKFWPWYEEMQKNEKNQT